MQIPEFFSFGGVHRDQRFWGPSSQADGKKKLDALSTVASGFEAQLFDLQPSSGVVPKDNSTHCFMLLKTQQL